MPKSAQIISIFLVLIFSSHAFANEIPPEKKADIQKLLEVTGKVNLAKNIAGRRISK